MLRKITVFVVAGLLLCGIYGCVAILAGTAGGAGTSVWLAGKLSQEFHVPYDKCVNAAEKALASLKLDVTKKTRTDTVTQLRSVYTDGKEIWIDIRRITENSTKVEVRVGAVNPDKIASDKILKRIQKNL